MVSERVVVFSPAASDRKHSVAVKRSGIIFSFD